MWRALVLVVLAVSAVAGPAAGSSTDPNDPQFPNQWALRNTGQTLTSSGQSVTGTPGADINATAAWGLTTGSPSVVVGVIDSELDYTHQDLAANVWTNPGGIGGCPAGTHGYNAADNNCYPPTITNGHGTAMAGVIGAVGNNGLGVSGVNQTTSMMSLAAPGSGSQVVTAIDWAISAKQAGVNVRVLNMSLYAGGQAVGDAIRRAGANEILFVAAAGNYGDNNDDYNRCSFGTVTTANTANLLCVTATDQNDNLWSWSNYGATTVDLGAPGDKMATTGVNNAYRFTGGTSAASAITAGAAALILSYRYLSAANLKAAIVNNVQPLPSLAGKVRSGGRLDVYCSMTNCRAGAANTTTTTAPLTTTTTKTTATTTTVAPAGGTTTPSSGAGGGAPGSTTPPPGGGGSGALPAAGTGPSATSTTLSIGELRALVPPSLGTDDQALYQQAVTLLEGGDTKGAAVLAERLQRDNPNADLGALLDATVPNSSDRDRPVTAVAFAVALAMGIAALSLFKRRRTRPGSASRARPPRAFNPNSPIPPA